MIRSLTIEAFRNLSCSDVNIGHGVTVLYGDNGSGKSSFLEALYYLSFGRSFRSSDADAMIFKDGDQFVLRAELAHNGLESSCAILRYGSRSTAKVGGTSAPLSRIARLCPALFADSDSYRNFMTSSTYRRRAFDWLGFHVKPDYLAAVRRYNSVLKNRNAALKQSQDPSPWDALLIPEAEKITLLRQEVFAGFLEHFCSDEVSFLGHDNWVFNPGYDSSVGFAAALSSSLERDRLLKRTTIGPHTADWRYTVHHQKAKDVLSQGQQKTAFFYSLAAQDRLMQANGIIPALLIDDYAAELDSENSQLLHSLVFNRAGQAVITTIQKPVLALPGNHAAFHVEHGALQEA